MKKWGLPLFFVILMGIVAWQRNHVFMDEVSLWRDVVKKIPYNQRAWLNLSFACRQVGDSDCAMYASQKTLELYPEPLAFMNLGNIMQDAGRLDESESLYEEAIKRAEVDSITEEMKRTVMKLSYYELGNVNFKRHDLKRAEDYYRKALKIDPEYSPAWNNLGYVLMKQGRCEEARSALFTALKLSPEDELARENLELLKECR